MMLALKVEPGILRIVTDFQLVANQVSGDFEVKDPKMMEYSQITKNLLEKFRKYEIVNAPRSNTEEADMLAKSASEGIKAKEVIMSHLYAPSTDKEEVLEIGSQDSWMTEIAAYLKDGTLPKDKVKAARVARISHNYALEGDVLYKMSFLHPWSRCLRATHGKYVLQEIHEGICGSHLAHRSLSRKAVLQGYY